jgi:hypothetical protein
MTEAAAEPPWDERQRAVIDALPAERVIVTAGPGEGKSAIACARIARLIGEGVTPSKILLISFTRTAVAEIRNRIRSYVASDRDAAEVRITTLDSHAWQLRHGFDAGVPKMFDRDTYEASIEAVVDLLKKRDEQLLEFLAAFEHVLIDEAQDVVGVRAELIVELVRALDSSCGVTVFADPAQAIYGFTTADKAVKALGQSDVMAQLRGLPGTTFRPLPLGYIYRISDRKLATLFERCRESVVVEKPAPGHVERVRSVICANASQNLGSLNHEQVAQWCSTSDDDALVLFRQRADAWITSSYSASKGIQHRLRLSGAPTIVAPWLGWTLSEHPSVRLTKPQWEALWTARSASAPALYQGIDPTWAWNLLRRFAGAGKDVVNMDALRAVVARARPPIELCIPDWGTKGPIIGTIHASKGREASRVVLVMLEPPTTTDDEDTPEPTPSNGDDRADARDAETLEEGRVLYVGATRGKSALLVGEGRGARSGALESGRVWRSVGKGLYQIEVGRDGDVDRVAHLTWSNARDVQQSLVTAQLPSELVSQSRSDWHWKSRLFLRGTTTPIGQLSTFFQDDRDQLWKRNKGKRPGDPYNMHLVGLTTVALTDDDRARAQPPFQQSGFALAPVVRGFAFLKFFSKKR